MVNLLEELEKAWYEYFGSHMQHDELLQKQREIVKKHMLTKIEMDRIRAALYTADNLLTVDYCKFEKKLKALTLQQLQHKKERS